MAVKKLITRLAAGKTFINTLYPLSFTTVLRVSRSGTVLKKATGSPGSGEFRHTGLAVILFDLSNPAPPGGEPITIVYKD